MEKINSEDFCIYKHKQNILNIISLVVNKIKFFREIKIKEISEQIDNYIESILLLLPSFLFREKNILQILEICIYYCKKLGKDLNENQENLYQKLLLFLYSIDENKNEILNILNNKEARIKQELKEEIIFLKEIRSNRNNFEKLINKNTSEKMKNKIYYEIAAYYFKNKVI